MTLRPTAPQRRFATRLTLAVSFLIIGACAALSWIIVSHDLRQIRLHLADRGRNIGEHLALNAELSVLSGDTQSLSRLARDTRLERDVVYCRFFDHDGQLLASEGEVPEEDRPPIMTNQATPIGPLPVGTLVWEFQSPVLTPDVPSRREELEFFDEDASVQRRASPSPRRIGTVVVGVSLLPLNELRGRVFVTASAFTGLVTIFALFSTALMARAITRPLRALADAAYAIARGKLDTTVPVHTHDEVGALAESFNVMANSLASSRAALEEHARTLEEKVRVRTERLEVLNRELLEADRMKSEFLATVSHELRTPLSVIIGYADMLVEGAGGPITGEQGVMLEAIRRYSRQQLELVANVLDFSRLATGRVSAHVERFALEPVLADVLAPHIERTAKRDVRFSLSIPTSIPELETDRVKLHEIVHNLVDNAVKFTTAGVIAIQVSFNPDQDRVGIVVRDTGRGIPPDALSRVFEPFLQVGDSSTRSTGGVGLGLSIVKQLVTVLGGSVSVSSCVGEGSAFGVEIPRRLGVPGGGDGCEPEPAGTSVAPSNGSAGAEASTSRLGSPAGSGAMGSPPGQGAPSPERAGSDPAEAA